MARDRVVITGAGQAGFQTCASLRQEGFEGAIALIGDEDQPPYQRPPLSKAFVKEDGPVESLWFRPEAFYSENNVDVRWSDPAVSIDCAAKRVELASGGSLDYGHLVLATGARNRTLSIPGAELDGVVDLRTSADALDIRARLAHAKRVVVIGAGFIGLEIAATARAFGCAVTVLEAASRVMGRAVSEELSAHCLQRHRAAGIAITLNARIAGIVGVESVAAVELADVTRIPADLVIVGVGVVPNSEIAATAGLAIENGIAVDAMLRTSEPAIYAIGDCASFPMPDGARVRLESVQNAADQARAVARAIANPVKAKPYDAVPWFWSDQGDLRLQMAGLTSGASDRVVIGSPEENAFSLLCFAGEKFLGVESINRPADHMAARRLMAAGGAPTLAESREPGFDLRAFAKSQL